MHPRTREVLTFLAHHRTTLEEAVELVPVTLRGHRPASGRWSVAEILDHLGIVEASITRLVRKQTEASRARGLGAETDSSPVVPTLDVARILDRSQRIEAGSRAVPTSGATAAAAWDALGQRRRDLEDLITSVDGLALGEVAIAYPHPVLGALNAWQWLIFVGAHEGRHAEQIRELAQRPPG